MPAIHADLLMDCQSQTYALGTKPIIVIEEVLNRNELNMTTTGSSSRFSMLSGVETLKFGSRLQEFKDTFSKSELDTARIRVVEEELKLGAPLTLARLRSQKGISQTVLASKIGKTQANMSLIERGHTDPGMRTIRKISDVLGTTTDDVIKAIETAETLNA